MAAPVVYTSDDLKCRLAELFIECKVRAAREDELTAEIERLRAELVWKATEQAPEPLKQNYLQRARELVGIAQSEGRQAGAGASLSNE